MAAVRVPIQGFSRSLAFVIGIDAYRNGIPRLTTAVDDARAVAEALQSQHGFEVELILDESATIELLRRFLRDLQTRVRPADRVLFYFAGHGVALDGDEGLAGFVLPQDANRQDTSRFLPMGELRESLSALPCRHFLAILDCCFAGAFRWSTTRHIGGIAGPLHIERYEWYIRDPAWQVLTSASHSQRALDVAAGETLGARGETTKLHSPFAAALLAALGGAADTRGKNGSRVGCTTATEMYLYIRDRLETPESRIRQTPGLWHLPKHHAGEFVFLTPGTVLTLEPAPELLEKLNPWRGLKPYTEAHANLFFGRKRVAQALAQHILAAGITIVVGPSGCGKSSLVSAGAVPVLREADPELRITAPPLRPGAYPLHALAASIASISGGEPQQHPTAQTIQQDVSALLAGSKVKRLLLLVDQLEELLTQSVASTDLRDFTQLLADLVNEHEGRVSVCCTLRVDYEGPFRTSALADGWTKGRFLVPSLTQDEYRRIIEEPAEFRVLRFESEHFVDELINEVIRVPGSLPLLSFVLSEMYRRCVRDRRGSRELKAADYLELHGLAGALQQRAQEEYSRDDSAQRAIRRIVLRMVSIDGGGEPTRRQVRRSELEYADKDENALVVEVVDRLVEARLVVADLSGGMPVVEPAHDALIRGWGLISELLRVTRVSLPVFRALSLAAAGWQQSNCDPAQLWDADPRLLVVQRDTSSETVGDLLRLNRTEANFVAASLHKRKRRQIVRLALSSIAALVVIVAGFAVAYFSSQSSERATTAALLDGMNRLEQTIDGPRQLEALFAALDAADLSRSKFGHIIAPVRSGLMKALLRVREVDSRENSGPQVRDLQTDSSGGELLLLFRRDSGEVRPSPIVAAAWTINDSPQRREITVDRPPSSAWLCPSGACIVLQHKNDIEITGKDGRVIVDFPIANDDFVPVDGDRDHRRLFVVSEKNSLMIYEREYPERKRVIQLGPGRFNALIVSSNGRKLLALGEERSVVVDVSSLALKSYPTVTRASSQAVALSSDGAFMLYPGGAGEVMEYDFSTRQSLLVARYGNQRVDRIKLAPDDQTFAFTSRTEGAIFVVGRKGRGLLFGGPLFAGKDPAIAFSADSRKLFEIGYLDRTLRTFDISEPAFPQQSAREEKVTRLALCGTDPRVFWGNEDGLVGSYSVEASDRRELARISAPVKRLVCADGRSIASLDGAGRIVLLTPTDGKVESTQLTPERMVASDIAALGRGEILAAVGKALWKVGREHSPTFLLNLKRNDVSRLALNAHSSKLAAGTFGSGTIEMVELDASLHVGPIPAHQGQVFDLAFLPWSDRLASAGTIGGSINLSVSLWEPTGKQVSSVEAHATLATALAVDSVSRLLATGGSDGAVRLWDDQLRKVGPDLVRHDHGVRSISIAGNGDVLASADSETITFSYVAEGRLMAHGCARATRHPRIGMAERNTVEAGVKEICAKVRGAAQSEAR